MTKTIIIVFIGYDYFLFDVFQKRVFEKLVYSLVETWSKSFSRDICDIKIINI